METHSAGVAAIDGGHMHVSYSIDFGDRAFEIAIDPDGYAGEDTYRVHAEVVTDALLGVCKMARERVEGKRELDPMETRDLGRVMVAIEALCSLSAALVSAAEPEGGRKS